MAYVYPKVILQAILRRDKMVGRNRKEFRVVTQGGGNAAFKNLHPAAAAGRKLNGKDLPPYLDSDGKESKFIRCKQCGFPFDKTKHSKGSGYGNLSFITVTDGGGSVAANTKDEVVNGGCPLCGASGYE